MYNEFAISRQECTLVHLQRVLVFTETPLCVSYAMQIRIVCPSAPMNKCVHHCWLTLLSGFERGLDSDAIEEGIGSVGEL